MCSSSSKYYSVSSKSVCIIQRRGVLLGIAVVLGNDVWLLVYLDNVEVRSTSEDSGTVFIEVTFLYNSSFVYVHTLCYTAL